MDDNNNLYDSFLGSFRAATGGQEESDEERQKREIREAALLRMSSQQTQPMDLGGGQDYANQVRRFRALQQPQSEE